MKREVAKRRRRFAHLLSLNDPAHRTAVVNLLLDAWVRPQADHHRRNAQRRRKLVARATGLRLALFAARVGVAVAHAMGVGRHLDGSASPLARVDLWVWFLTVSLPARAAALHVMLWLDDHERLGARSRHMSTLLNGLADRLASAHSAREIHSLVDEAERIMDLESAEWAESLHGRQPEFTG